LLAAGQKAEEATELTAAKKAGVAVAEQHLPVEVRVLSNVQLGVCRKRLGPARVDALLQYLLQPARAGSASLLPSSSAPSFTSICVS